METAHQDARIDGANNTLVQVVNGVVHIGGRRKLALTLYENRAAQLAESAAETALLSAYRRDVVEMIGRDGALTNLRAAALNLAVPRSR